MIETFRVVAVSSNTNSFGLKQFVALNRTGVGFKACANSLNIPTQGTDINVPFEFNLAGKPVYNFGGNGYELPEMMPIAPKDVIKAVYEGDVEPTF